ncbi:MAG: ABC transporter ATP-binding protein [Holosporales bacterium]
MPALTLSHIFHAYGKTPTLRDVSLTLEQGALLALLGPSGCGKTTLLRLIAGLESPTGGTIHHHAELWSNKDFSLPPAQRRVGVVFQDYALFPHLTALKNVLFGMQPPRRDEGLSWLSRMGIAHLADTYPHLLSGGQQQRVALARALAMKPQLLLLDEPFSGLDAQLRQQVRLETRQLLKSEGIAAILVTHDADEAMHMADSVALMRAGQIEQIGTPAEMYCRPATPFAARFFGLINEFTCPVRSGFVETPFGLFPNEAAGQSALVLVRPQGFTITPPDCAPDAVMRVVDSCFVGHHRLYTGALMGSEQLVMVAADPEPDYPAGTVLKLKVNRRDVFVF